MEHESNIVLRVRVEQFVRVNESGFDESVEAPKEAPLVFSCSYLLELGLMSVDDR